MKFPQKFLSLTKTGGKDAPVSEALKARDQGDQLRDEGRFAAAADAYGAYLDAHPDDFDIWVQRGNCLKDSSEFAASKMSYENAVRIKPADADVHLQLGHLLKLQGRRDEAILAYKKSHELDADSGLAAVELRSLGVKIKAAKSPLESAEQASGPVKIFDISDLLGFLNVHNRVTGIQRVQSCIINEYLSKDTSSDVIFSYCDQSLQTVFALSASAVSRLVDLVIKHNPTQQEVNRCLETVFASKVKVVPRKDDVYIILGAFWIGDDYTGALLSMKTVGVKIGVYIYDLIPLTHPQFVTESTRQDVLDKFGDIMSLADFVLTISDYVAKEVDAVLRNDLGRNIPVFPVPLAHELPAPDSEDDELDDDFIASIPKEFVLCVCTLEGRKNHLLLLNAWSSLNRKYGGKIPRLVLVGKWGWRIEEFRAQLEAENGVDGKIIILGNLGDSELGYLYQNCLFTVFPSFVEGWGLPVGESLAFGKPCIASNTSSIPEVGGEFCRYFSPYDPAMALAEIEKALTDRDDLRQWTQRIESEFRVRTWSDVADNFLKQMDRAVGEQKSTGNNAAVDLESGRLYWLTRQELNIPGHGSWRARTSKFVCSTGWHSLEDWGLWSFRRSAKIVFGTKLPGRSKIRVLLELRLPPPTVIGILAIGDETASKETTFQNGHPKWVSVDCESDENGVVRLHLERTGDVRQLDSNRPLFCGVSAIAYHEKNDIAARLDLMESLVLFQGGKRSIDAKS